MDSVHTQIKAHFDIFYKDYSTFSEKKDNKSMSYHSILREITYQLIFSREVINNFGPNYKNLKVLDIGCGSGHVEHFLISMGFSPENIWAIDINDYIISYCKKTLPSTLNIVCDDFRTKDLNIKFDIIISNGTLMYYDDDEVKNITQKMAEISGSNALLLFREPTNKANYDNYFEKDIVRTFSLEGREFLNDHFEILRIYPCLIENYSVFKDNEGNSILGVKDGAIIDYIINSGGGYIAIYVLKRIRVCEQNLDANVRTED